MDQETARRRSTAIGAGSVLIGGILSAWPDRLGALVSMDGRDARWAGLGDVVLGSGLLSGRAPRAWMGARIALNLLVIGRLLSLSSRPARFAAVLLALVSASDASVAAGLGDRAARPPEREAA